MLTRLAPRLVRTTLPITRAISADALAHTAPKDTEGPLFTGKKEKKAAEAKRNDTGAYKPKVTKGVRSKLATGSSGKGFDELKKRHDVSRLASAGAASAALVRRWEHGLGASTSTHRSPRLRLVS